MRNAETLNQRSVTRVQRSMGAAVFLAAALISYGLLRFPTTLTASRGGMVGATADLLILLAYAGVARFGVPWLARRSGYSLRAGLSVGLLAGGVFATEILLEYVLLPADNGPMGTLEYGSVLGLLFVCGIVVALKTGCVRQGVLGSVFAAVTGFLIWYVVALSVFYAFAGTARQAQVMSAEGNLADFALSGMSDFSAWLMQDWLGAGFFHLLLGPLLAGLLGLLGALVGRVLIRRPGNMHE